MPGVRIALLGVPLVARDGVAVHFDTRKAIALLAYLVLCEGPQSRDAVATLLWCDLDTDGARAALRRTLSTLKAALPDTALESDRRVLRLRRETMDIDLDRFRAALQRAGRHGHAVRDGCPACLPALVSAAALYRADFLTGFALRDSAEFDHWQVLQAETVRGDFAEALEGIVAALSRAERFEDAIAYAQRWLALDPLHEAAHRALMQVYSRSGRRSSALQQYRECVRILEEELAVSPLEETTRLYQAIKEHEERPPAPRILAVPAAEPVASHLLPLVGRSREWQALLEAYAAIRGTDHIIALEGEAGIGKTRLVTELLAHARSGGMAALSTRCFEGEADLAYAPVIQLLRSAIEMLQRSGGFDQLSQRDLGEVARLLPEVEALRPVDGVVQPREAAGAQTRFLEAICHVLLAAGGDQPLILALDDLQWADAASLECLAYLLRRLNGRHAGVILAWRGEEALPSIHLVRRVIVEAQRAGKATMLQIERLDRAGVAQLVDRVVPLAHSPSRAAELSDRLYKETEGLPLFLGEYLTAMVGGSLASALPGGVRDLLLSRLATVGEAGWQFLTAAAVLGRSFEFDMLREISGRDEEMAVTALEELCARGLVREVEGATEAPAYDFRHDKLRALVYDRTSLARRRLLHRRVAEALVGRSRSRHDDALAGQIAQHYHMAGIPAEAATSFQRAGDHARALYANREALAHYEAALALGHPAIAELQEALGDLRTLLGEYRAAAARYEAAAALSAGKDLARVEHKLGTVHHRWGEWELAESYYEEALRTLGAGTSAEHAHLYADWSMAAYHRRQTEQAVELAHKALLLSEQVGDRRALAQAHNMLGILESSSGNRAAARDHFGRSLAMAESLADLGARVAALQNLALVCRHDHDVVEARRLTLAALELCAALGDRHREAALHNMMADLLHAGSGEEAMAHLKQAVAIYAEIGVDAGTLRAEVWKLTEW